MSGIKDILSLRPRRGAFERSKNGFIFADALIALSAGLLIFTAVSVCQNRALILLHRACQMRAVATVGRCEMEALRIGKRCKYTKDLAEKYGIRVEASVKDTNSSTLYKVVMTTRDGEKYVLTTQDGRAVRASFQLKSSYMLVSPVQQPLFFQLCLRTV